MAQVKTSGKVAAIELEVGAGNPNFNTAVGLNNVTITGNVVYNWYSALWTQAGLHPGGSGPYSINNVQIYGNSFSGIQNSWANAVYPGEYPFTATTAAAFADPNVSLGDYASSLGVGDTDDSFLSAAAAQSSADWTSALTAAAVTQYLLAGFGL